MPHCVRWGPSSPTERGTASPTFRPMSVLDKRSPISLTVELLLHRAVTTADLQSSGNTSI